MCLRSISRSLELSKNIESNLKSHLLFYFFQKSTRVSRTRRKRSPPKDSFISSISEWLSNSNETLISSSRSEESHTSFGKKFKNILKLLKGILKLKGMWLSEN